MKEPIRILLLDEAPNDALQLTEVLKKGTLQVESIVEESSLEAAMFELTKTEYDIVLIEIAEQSSFNLQSFKDLKDSSNIPFIAFSRNTDPIMGERLIAAGAQDYLPLEGMEAPLLTRSIEYAISRNRDQLKMAHLFNMQESAWTVSQLAGRAEHPRELIEGAVKLLLQNEAFHSCWIVLLSEDDKVRYVAQEGVVNGFNEFIKNLNDNIKPPCFQRAYASEELVFKHEYDLDCQECPLEYMTEGRTSFVIKLIKKNHFFGYLSASIESFYQKDEDHIRLFKELSRDISLALYSLEQKAKKEEVDIRLKEQEQKLGALLNNIPGIAFRCRYDKYWTMEYLSRACEEILGYSSDELLNNKKLSYEDLIYKEDRYRVRKEIEEQLASKNNYTIEYRVVSRTNVIKWVWESGNKVLDSDGRLSHLEGYISDITDRKLSSELLSASEEKFRVLAENSVDCIWELDRRLRFKYISPSIFKIAGYTPEEILGKGLYKFTTFRDFIKMARIALGALAGKEQYQFPVFESRIKSRDGSLVFVEISGKVVEKPGGNSKTLQGSLRDITFRKENQKALEESEARFRAIYDHSPDMYISISSDTQKVILCNQTLLDKLNYTRDQIIGKDLYDLYPKEYRKKVEDINDRFLKEGRIIDEELKMLRNGMDPLEISLNAEAIRDENGKILYSIAACRDISEKKEAERELLRQNEQILKQVEEYQSLAEEYETLNDDLKKTNEELMSLNKDLQEAKELAEENERLKDAFLANMSHEIRTPMNAIIGFSNLLNHSNIHNDKRKFYSSMIINASDRLLKIINDIIDISRLDAQQFRLDRTKFSPSEPLKNSYEYFVQSDLLNKKPELDFKLVLPEDDDYVIISDLSRFGQVLDNLLTNAIKYTSKGLIEFGYDVKKDKEGMCCTFFVKDSGIGIPQEKFELVFERFRQIEELEYHEGAGLGLSISKGIIELLGGSIWLESEEGKGSTFYFKLPCERGEVARKPLPETMQGVPHLEGVYIIVAEDDYNTSEFLNVILEETGARVEFAVNGEILMDLMHDQLPDLVLLDINMPIKNGFECLKEMKDLGFLKQVRVIAQTAYANSEERDRCIKEGCNDYIAKPYTESKLLSVVRKVLFQPDYKNSVKVV